MDPNHVFNKYMQRIIDNIKSGTGFNASIKADQIAKGARLKYNKYQFESSGRKLIHKRCHTFSFEDSGC